MPTAVIVGAGIGGLAAGIVLRRAGWNVRILERAASPRELGFALALAPNALAALREIGIADTVARAGAQINVFDARRSDGFVMKRVRFHGERSVVTLRPALHGALLDAVGPESLLLGSAADRFTLTHDGVEVTFGDRPPLHGDILIGADGVGSVVRRQLHPEEAPPRASGYHALRGVTYDQSTLPGGVDAAVYLGDGIEAGAARASATAVYWYMSLVDELVGPSASSPGEVMERCTRGIHEGFSAIARAARPEDLRLEPLFVRPPIAEWGSGRATLLGDAAHPVLPHTAQGAALALEDAVALGLALKGNADVTAALRSYERVRSRRTRQVVRIGPMIAALTTTRSRLRIAGRNAAIRLLPGVVLSGTLKLHARDPHRELRAAGSS